MCYYHLAQGHHTGKDPSLLYKWQAQFSVAGARLMLLFSCLHLFPIRILLQQHTGIWTALLEAKGDSHQSNRVQAAIDRVHKTQQQQRKFQVLKKLGRILAHFPDNNRDLGPQNSSPTSVWKMSPGRADFNFPHLFWFSLCSFCSSTTLSGHHTLQHRRRQWMMPATECWEETLEGPAAMTPQCFCMCQTKYKIIPSKGKQKIPTNSSSGEFLPQPFNWFKQFCV